MWKIIFITLFITNISYAQNIKISSIDNLKTCRQDFAVKLCKYDLNMYRCFKFSKKGQDYLRWEEIFKSERIRTLVQKVNRRNSIVWKNHCLAIPDLNKNEIEYAPFPKKITSDLIAVSDNSNKIIVIDLEHLAWGAYKNEELINWSMANGGFGLCKETGKYTCKTPVGVWSIYKIKKGFQRSSLYPVDCQDKKKCGHPYFDIQKFGPKGEGIHGEREGHVFGNNISHGCVRTDKKSAEFLVDNFTEIGTKVIVLPY